MHVLVLGAEGQVGLDLQTAAHAEGIAVTAFTRRTCDITRDEDVRRAVLDSRATGVINAAAYTAVDRAEAEEDIAMAVNGRAPGYIARACAEAGLPLVHYSTDYVFDGALNRPYREDDTAAPINAYGRSKLAGERAVQEAGGTAAILRLSWVFSAHGQNFVKTMLRIAGEHKTLRIVDDQLGKPTPAAAAARAGLRALGASGIYHYAGDEPVSWAEFAQAIFNSAGLEVHVEPISTADYPTPARRPANSVLDTQVIAAELGIEPANWREGLDAVIAALQSTTHQTKVC